jgi:hypothetical protein
MEHKHESDGDGWMKSSANIALIIFIIIGVFSRLPSIGRTSPGGCPIGHSYY